MKPGDLVRSRGTRPSLVHFVGDDGEFIKGRWLRVRFGVYVKRHPKLARAAAVFLAEGSTYVVNARDLESAVGKTG